MIGGAFGDESAPEPEEEAREQPKGFNIPIEEYDDDLTPDLETEVGTEYLYVWVCGCVSA